VFSKDEFGELASAFNEMTMRLKEEEKMRTDFIDMLSHEIRTPLTSIRESVNLIKENVFGEVNERQKRFLDIAGDELERISNLLTRLMRVSSMASQIVDITLAPPRPGGASGRGH
jgi:signal transduction histidine kinase